MGFDIPILPDFDPTLISAHNLLNKLVQALTINRFALISGPPASGKTESGRYLSEILGWKSKIVNCHKGLSQEEIMQKIGIGVAPNGETKFVVTKGPLAEALINGELFILNEINLAKPGSLSFLFSILADVNETFNYYDVKEGRVVKKAIHKNFRFIGTQNPDGPGRNNINAALKNRAIEIYAPEYSDLELEALLRSKYPATRPPSPLGGEGRGEGGSDLASTLVQLYRDIARRIESQTIGGHAEGYVWNLRHLMRMAEGLSAFPPLEKGGEGGFDTPGVQVLRSLYDAVGVSLTPKDRASFFDAVKTYEYNIPQNVAEGFSPPSSDGTLKGSATQYNTIKITDEDVEAFKTKQAKLTINEVAEEFEIEEETAQRVMNEEKIEDLPTTARLIRNVLKALTTPKLSGIWLKGPAGTGKTKIITVAAKLLGAKVYDDTLTPQTDENQLKGDLRPALVTLKDGTKKLGFQNVPSALVNALREANASAGGNVAEGFSPPSGGGTLKGSATLVICILDEAGFAKPAVIEELNSLLDRDGGIWVISETGDRPDFIERAPNFKLVMASNTYGYSGVNLQSDAFRSRTKEIYVGFEYTADELAKILNPPTPPFEKGGIKGGFDPTLSLSLAQTILSIRELFVAQGKSEARISLREVKRIKEYIATFAPTQGLTRATLNALWLTLGADLRPSEVNGELGDRLRQAILSTKIPGVEKEALKEELDKILKPKPVELDASLSGDENLWRLAASSEPILGKLSRDEADAYKLKHLFSTQAEIPPSWFHHLYYTEVYEKMLLDQSEKDPIDLMNEMDKFLLRGVFDKYEPFLASVILKHPSLTVEDIGALMDKIEDQMSVSARGIEDTGYLVTLACHKNAAADQFGWVVERLDPKTYVIEERDVDRFITRLFEEAYLDSEKMEYLLGAIKRYAKAGTDIRIAPRIHKNKNITPDALTKLIEFASDKETARIGLSLVREIGMRDDLTPKQIRSLIDVFNVDRVEVPSPEEKLMKAIFGGDSEENKGSMDIKGFAYLLTNPLLSERQFSQLYGKLKYSIDRNPKRGEMWYKAFLAFSRSASFVESRYDLLLRMIGSVTDPGWKIKLLGAVAESKGVTGDRFGELIKEMNALKVSDKTKRMRVAIALRNPEATPQLIADFIQGHYTNGDQDLDMLVEIFANPSAGEENQRTIFDRVMSNTGGERRLALLSPMLEAKNVSDGLYEEILIEMVRGDPEFILQVSFDQPNAAKIRERLIKRYEELVITAEKIGELALDSAVRISAAKGDVTDLPGNLKVLRSVIEIPPVPPLQKGGVCNVPPFVKGGEGGFDIPILPDFDPTLVSAHNLVNKLVQALVINRFALISGPPASGKTESGRYLSEILGWKSKIVNCHKGLSQEEMMQKIGVVPNGETKFVVTDGPLAEALINGELFILNEINLAKPGSLSFLFSILADVNETFNYYDVKEGRVVKKAIHKNFRFIGTQNTEGPGRKDINAALKNRAIEIYAPEYSDLELEALLRSKYPATRPPSPLGGEGRGEGGSDLASTLVQLYRDIARRIESQTIGGHAEGYVWNLRHLMRMAEGLVKLPSPLVGEGQGEGEVILKALYDAVGVSLTPKDRESFFDAVKTYEYNINNVAQGFSPADDSGRSEDLRYKGKAIKITDADIEAFKERQAKLTIREATEEFGIEEGIVKQVIKEEKIEDIPTTARLIRNVLKALTTPKLSGIWLKGPAGTGKTKIAMLAAKLLGAKLYDDTLTPQTDESQLKGDLRPALVTLKDGTKKLGFQNVPSALVNALREANASAGGNVAEGFSPPSGGGTLKGSATLVICILDEAAFARPDVIEELNSLLDRDGGIWVISETGEEPEFIKRAPNFKLILASNTYGYSGVNLQSEAFRSRTKEIYVGFEYTADELAKILGGDDVVAKPCPERGRGVALPEDVAQDFSPANDSGRSKDLRYKVGRASSATTAAGDRLPADGQEAKQSREIPPFPPFKKGGATPKTPPDSAWTPASNFATSAFKWISRLGNQLSRPASGRAPSQFTPPDIFDSKGESISEILKGEYAEEEALAIEGKFTDIKDRLLGMAAAFGRRGDITLEFDPECKTASMSSGEGGKVFRVGPEFLLKRSTEELLNIAMHEGEHAELTRVGSGFFYESEIKHHMLGTVEDIRMNARSFDRAPGRAEEFKNQLVKDYHISLEQVNKEMAMAMGTTLPHEAFLAGIMSREYGGTSPWDNDPLVGPAIDEVWDAVQRAKAERPTSVAQVDELEVIQYVMRFEKILKGEIYPVYQELYKESVKQVEQMLKEGKGKPKDGEGEPNGSAGGGSPIDPKDLSKEARKLLEERAKKMNEKTGPTGSVGERGKKARKMFDKPDGEDGDDGKKKKPGTPKDGTEGTPKEGKTGGKEGSLARALNKRHEDYNRHQESVANKTYSKFLGNLKGLSDKVFAVLDQLLKPNTDFEYDGFFSTGPRVDIKRALRAINGLLANLNVFERKVEPSERNHRFSLLLDASASMTWTEARERGGLGLATMFMDVFERLGLPYSLDAFHNQYLPLKGFAQSLKTVEERNVFFNNLLLNIWGGGATNIRDGIRGSLARIMKERESDPRSVEFLFVLTDGEETHKDGPTIKELCEEAAKKGVIVVGIGIGEGMQTVRDNFSVFLLENNPENLPRLLAEFIKEYVKMMNEEDY